MDQNSPLPKEKELHFINNLSKNTIHLITVIIFSVLVIGSIITSPTTPPNNGQVLAAEPVPLPTEINENFITQVEQCFIPTAALYGYTLRISSGFRTLEEQNELYEQGRTIDGHIVTDAPGGRSIHNYGYAVDIADRWRGYFINWERLGKIAEFCRIQQGQEGDWAHFEHRGGLTTAQMEAGMRPPLLELPCEIMAIRTTNEEKLTLKDLEECGAPKF